MLVEWVIAAPGGFYRFAPPHRLRQPCGTLRAGGSGATVTKSDPCHPTVLLIGEIAVVLSLHMKHGYSTIFSAFLFGTALEHLAQPNTTVTGYYSQLLCLWRRQSYLAPRRTSLLASLTPTGFAASVETLPRLCIWAFSPPSHALYPYKVCLKMGPNSRTAPRPGPT